MVLYSSLGLILLLISYLITDLWVKLGCISVGAGLFAYGVIGGIVSGLQTTIKREKEN